LCSAGTTNISKETYAETGLPGSVKIGVVGALADPAARHHHVGAEELVTECLGERRRLVGAGDHPVGDRAVSAHGGSEQVAVGVIDAVAPQGPAGLDELGAG
jgi:hypothetical protein